jgi:thioredoxin 1
VLEFVTYKTVLAVSLGALVGVVYSRLTRCSTGACPLTSNPWTAGLYGAAIGLMLSLSWSGARALPSDSAGVSSTVSETNPSAPAGSAGPRQQGEITMVRQIETAEDFDREVLQASKPVLVDFYATWCGPCRMVTPILDQLAGELSGRAEVVKVDVDKVGDLAARYKIMGVPTVMLFDQGKLVKTFVGVRSKVEYASAVQQTVTK